MCIYIYISIIYHFSTIDDLKDSVAVAALERGVESSSYDKGYSKKSENRFENMFLVWQKVFFFFFSGLKLLQTSSKFHDTINRALWNADDSPLQTHMQAAQLVSSESPSGGTQAVRRHPVESACGPWRWDSNAQVYPEPWVYVCHHL